MIIIIVLKLDSSEVDPRLDSGHKLGWLLTRVNLRIKIVIIKPPDPGGKASSFKTRPGGRLRVKLDPLGPDHGSGWLLTQYKDKNNYYHSFKAWFGGWPEINPRSWVKMIIYPD